MNMTTVELPNHTRTTAEVFRNLFDICIPVLLTLVIISLVAFRVDVRASERAAVQRDCSSWLERQALIAAITEPTVLNPQIRQLFPASSVASLALQVDEANKKKALQKIELVRINGVRPPDCKDGDFATVPPPA
jgi:hypothetical protein